MIHQICTSCGLVLSVTDEHYKKSDMDKLLGIDMEKIEYVDLMFENFNEIKKMISDIAKNLHEVRDYMDHIMKSEAIEESMDKLIDELIIYKSNLENKS